MSENQCKATTKSGSQCRIKAINADGYCHLHDPKTKAYREEQRQNLKPLPSMIAERRFSERRGYRPVAETPQVEAISIELRNSLWNAISQNALSHLNSKFAESSFFGGMHDNFIRDLWVYFFKKPIDLIPSKARAITETILSWYLTCEWYEVYDFVEGWTRFSLLRPCYVWADKKRNKVKTLLRFG